MGFCGGFNKASEISWICVFFQGIKPLCTINSFWYNFESSNNSNCSSWSSHTSYISHPKSSKVFNFGTKKRNSLSAAAWNSTIVGTLLNLSQKVSLKSHVGNLFVCLSQLQQSNHGQSLIWVRPIILQH